MRIRGRSSLLLFILLLAGGVVGDIIGSLAARAVPVLGHTLTFGIPSFSANLSLLQFNLGLSVQINPIGLLGLVAAILIWLRV